MPPKWRNFGGWLGYGRRCTIGNVVAADVREHSAERAI
jgi:hypothetical protein